MYSIDEIEAITGITRRMVRKLRAIGIVPPPTGGRCYARYDDRHIRRIRAYLQVRDQHTTLSELAERCAAGLVR